LRKILPELVLLSRVIETWKWIVFALSQDSYALPWLIGNLSAALVRGFCFGPGWFGRAFQMMIEPLHCRIFKLRSAWLLGFDKPCPSP
jgi:hypothetical protein